MAKRGWQKCKSICKSERLNFCEQVMPGLDLNQIKEFTEGLDEKGRKRVEACAKTLRHERIQNRLEHEGIDLTLGGWVSRLFLLLGKLVCLVSDGFEPYSVCLETSTLRIWIIFIRKQTEWRHKKEKKENSSLLKNLHSSEQRNSQSVEQLE